MNFTMTDNRDGKIQPLSPEHILRFYLKLDNLFVYKLAITYSSI